MKKGEKEKEKRRILRTPGAAKEKKGKKRIGATTRGTRGRGKGGGVR